MESSFNPEYIHERLAFYYNKMKNEQDGIYDETINEKWLTISFMIFRTGSVLIVGN